MATEETPGDASADDGMADWAEALLEQKSTEAVAPESGGVRSLTRFPGTLSAREITA